MSSLRRTRPLANDSRVDTQELLRWLIAEREHRGVELEDIAYDLLLLSGSERAELEWLVPRNISDMDSVVRRLRRFEQSTSHEVRQKEQLFTLLKIYQMSHVMLGPLLADPTSDVCLQESLSNFAAIQEAGSGKNCTYSFPQRRLRGADPAFALIELNAAGSARSDEHSHPGTEILLCLQGSADLVFPRLGLSTKLEYGDVIHFAAHEAHYLNGLRKNARFFVVRCAQLHKGGAVRRRLDSIADFRRELRQTSLDSRKQLGRIRAIFQEQIDPWLTQSNAGQSLSARRRAENVPFTIRDQVGCGRLIQHFCALRRVSIDALIEKMAANSIKVHRVSRDHLWKIRRGMTAPTWADIEAHARALDIPLVLFAPYFFDPQPLAVVTRSANNNDFHTLERELFHIPGGVDYKIPQRILADSDVAIMQLNLGGFSETEWNSHPGHEAILVLNASIELKIKTPAALVRRRAEAGELLHFDSTFPHQVIGQEENTRVLVIRFLGFFDHQSDIGPIGDGIE